MSEETVYAPHDIEAERQVIGACLLSPAATTEILNELRAEDFYSNSYRHMYNAIGELHISSSPVNPQTVMRHLKDKPSLDGKTTRLEEVGGASMVTAATVSVLAEDSEYWCAAVKKHRQERDLLDYATWLRQSASQGTDITTLRNKAEEKLVALGQESMRGTIAALADDTTAITNRIDRYITDPDAITGLETGWGPFDHYLDGLQEGNVSIVYAPSSRFKSLFVTNIGFLLAKKGIPGLWYTTEMPLLQVHERIVQLDSGLNFRWLRRDRTINKFRTDISQSIKHVSKYPIYICDKSDVDITSMRAEVMRHVRWNKIKYVIVDLVDMISTPTYRDDSVAQQSAVMKAMKALAKAANVHIILVSHIAKGDRNLRSAADLDMEDMKGSSSKYQDVDAAISVMPVEYNNMLNDWQGLTRQRIAQLLADRKDIDLLVTITKNRHGEIGRIPMKISMKDGGRINPVVGKKMVQATIDDVELIGDEEEDDTDE